MRGKNRGKQGGREDARKNRFNDIHVHGRVKRETLGIHGLAVVDVDDTGY